MKQKNHTVFRASRIKNSPFADFHMDLRGYDIVNKATGKKYMKVAVWNMFKDNPVELRKVQLMKHESFRFISNDNLNFKYPKTK